MTTIITWAESSLNCAAMPAPRPTIVTTAATVSAWTANTLEAMPIARRMARLGVEVLPYTSVTAFDGTKCGADQHADGRTNQARRRTDHGHREAARRRISIEQLRERWEEAGIASLTRIGDCWAPSTIQQAVYTGHKWARELDEAPETLIPRELPMIESGRVKVAP